jgi:hypothetical protein
MEDPLSVNMHIGLYQPQLTSSPSLVMFFHSATRTSMMEAIKRSQHRRPHTIEASADDRGGGPSLRTRRRPQPMNMMEASAHEHDRGATMTVPENKSTLNAKPASETAG